MQILTTIAGMKDARRHLGGQSLGLVPTMGALHAGHLSLVTAARQANEAVAATIFVNPTQFGPNEDFSRYPRTFEADCELLRYAGVDILFAPTAEEMYPPNAATYVIVEGISDRLDGASRPGHFRGVTTIVAKLFHIFAPTRAYFGQKDAAQLAVLRQMVRDLNFDLELVACPIVRDPDGLALSSRNRYLTTDERRQALVLRRALTRVEKLAAEGESSTAPLLTAAHDILTQEPAIKLDYLAAVDPDTLIETPSTSAPTLVAIAAFAGTTRLIDNTLLIPLS